MELPRIPFILAEIFVLFFAIGLHEFAHCKFADMAGDPTPRIYGRVTLNLTKHFEPMGTFMMAITTLTGFGIGWGRPAPMDPRKMKNPRWDWFVAVAAGPLTNLLQAIVYALFVRLFLLQLGGEDSVSEFARDVLQLGTLTNLGLCIFNLIPFGPLDGQWLLGILLPERLRWSWFRFNIQVGIPGLFILVLLLQWQHVSLLQGPVANAYKALTGFDTVFG